MLNLSAQNIDDMMEMINGGKLKEAKDAVDKYLSNPKKQNDPDGWYVKGKVYNALSKESTNTFVQSFSMKMEAFEAFQKNQSLDKKDVRMKLEEYIPYFDIYAELYNAGIKNYNDKDFEGAFTAFKKTNEVKDFILSKGYKNEQIPLVTFDTALIMNVAICAYNAKREADMYEFYQKIVDANIVGKEYKDVYQLMIENYYKNGDATAASNLLSKAKKLYPEESGWYDIELKQVELKDGKSGLLKKYEELISENPKNFVFHYNYAVELYNTLHGKDASNSGDTTISTKLISALQKAIELEEKGEVTATILMCNHLYNAASDRWNDAQSIKNTSPEQVKKKNALKSSSMKIMDQCISFGEQVVTFYEGISDRSTIQNANYKIILGYLIDFYSIKKDPKAAIYEKKNQAVNQL
jgi:tetratricopeptide (TPR) repeat protein